MNTHQKLIRLAIFSMALIMTQASVIYAAAYPYSQLEEAVAGWEKLGSKKVNYGLDRDEINVTILEGRFTKLKLKIRSGGVNMHKVTVHFGNGQKQEVALRNNFRRGSESRVIDLEGGKRVIKKVVFWYDSKNVSRRRATVELWGR